MTRKVIMKPIHKAKMNVHKGDTVLITTGKDKGSQGRVERTFPRTDRVIVEGKNIAKRHLKASGTTRQAGIIEKPMPLHVSNVMVVCTECGKPTRVAHDRVPQGQDQKVRVRRICKQCGRAIQEHSYTAGS
jgi:large subunit ribosomal protein L24